MSCCCALVYLISLQAAGAYGNIPSGLRTKYCTTVKEHKNSRMCIDSIKEYRTPHIRAVLRVSHQLLQPPPACQRTWMALAPLSKPR